MSRLGLAVVNVHGHETELEVRVRLDTVELWSGKHCCAVFDRMRLRRWLATPEGVCAVDEAAFAPAGSRIGLTVDPLVPWWPLAARDLAAMRTHV